MAIIPHTLSAYSKKELDKIGSLFHLITKESDGGLYSTRLLKLIYLIDERSVEEIGVPVTGLKYNIAEKGPLAVDIWREVQNPDTYFKKYIGISNDHIKGYFIRSFGKTSDESLLSEYERDLVKRIVQEYKSDVTSQVIDHIHEKENSLWRKIVEEHKIDFNRITVTDFKIDFSELTKSDELKGYLLKSYFSTRGL